MLLEDVRGGSTVATYDAWCAAYKEAWNGRLLSVPSRRSASPDFTGWIEYRRVRGLEFVHSDSMPFGGRTGATSDYIGIQVSLRHGGESVQLRDPANPQAMTSPVSVWDGQLVESFELLEPGEYFDVLIPRAAMVSQLGTQFALPAPIVTSNSAAMRMLDGLVRSLCLEFSTMHAWELDAVRNAMLELVGSLAHEGEHVSSGAVTDGMLRAVNQWIDQNLLEGEISSARAASEHGISVRSLHRLFERHGESFSSTVRARRLGRALDDLAATSDSVTQIASKWGYSDTSHFCRELKRRHGVTPTEYRRASRTAPAAVRRAG